MHAGGVQARLPYDNIPRLLLAWVCTEAVRTQRRELVRSARPCQKSEHPQEHQEGAEGEIRQADAV